MNLVQRHEQISIRLAKKLPLPIYEKASFTTYFSRFVDDLRFDTILRQMIDIQHKGCR